MKRRRVLTKTPTPAELAAAREAALEKEADLFEAQEAAQKAANQNVHPFTASLPMMPDRELDALAKSIKEHGQLEPIIYDANGVLVDGRCRLEACRRAGVEPKSITLAPEADPLKVWRSYNVLRQNLTAGQRAMLYVIGYPNATLTELVAESGLSRTIFFKVLFIRKYAPASVDAVIKGDLLLNDCYDQIKARVDQSRERSKQFQMLQKFEPDLAQEIADEQMEMAEAWPEFKRRNPEIFIECEQLTGEKQR